MNFRIRSLKLFRLIVRGSVDINTFGVRCILVGRIIYGGAITWQCETVRGPGLLVYPLLLSVPSSQSLILLPSFVSSSCLALFLGHLFSRMFEKSVVMY